MSEIKPNHICKNKYCNKNHDGQRKHYYACDYCDRTESWRSVACSIACWQEYQKQVLKARSNNQKVETLPERTDMSKAEVKELIGKSSEEVFQNTKNELASYINDTDEVKNFSEIVEQINNEIDKKTSSRTRKKKNVSTK